MPRSEEIQSLVRKAIPDSEVTVQDQTGGGDHFELTILSPAFRGKTLMEQHQMVHASLTSLRDQIHALTIKTKAL